MTLPKEKQELVSVIIPVFNSKKFLHKCINSIREQSYSNIEILIVDDGSSDGSLDEIADLANQDPRIHVFRQNNKGVSTARNLGLAKAHGDYICFVDSDDYLDKNYIEHYYKLLSESGLDIAVGYKNYDYKNTASSSVSNTHVIPASQAVEDIYTGKLNVAVWNKFYRTSFLKEHDIVFDPEIWYGEGMLFNIACFIKTNKLIASDKMVYHQTYNPNSAMRNFNLESNLCGIRSMEIQKKMIHHLNKRVQRAWAFHLRCYNMSILKGIIKTHQESGLRDQYKKCIRGLRKKISVVVFAPVQLKTKCIYLAAAIFPVKIATRLVNREIKQSSSSIE